MTSGKTEPELLFSFFDDLLETATFPDYRSAHNGLQVQGERAIGHLATAVDASEEVILAAIAAGADALLVHHGLFWSGQAPITGRLHRKVAPLIRSGVALYAVHLPLDAHPEVGNSAVLARRLGLEPGSPFGRYEEREIGFSARVSIPRTEMVTRLEGVLGGPVHLISGGPEEIRRVAVVTGGGGSFIAEAAERGIDTLITGEASHHAHGDAHELGVNVLLGGHYRTEVWGVQALAQVAAERFGITWGFLDFPSGL
jgi:dinuclear metal center YbgI/SA1388 family protein